MIPKSMSPTPIGDGNRFPACAKPWHGSTVWSGATAGEGRSDKIMRRPRMIPKSGDRFSDKIMRRRRINP